MNKLNREQQNALHLWVRQIAEVLAEADIDMSTFIKVPIKPNEHNVKDEIIRPVAASIMKETSTTSLTNETLNLLIDSLTLAFAEKGIVIPPFPVRTE